MSEAVEDGEPRGVSAQGCREEGQRERARP